MLPISIDISNVTCNYDCWFKIEVSAMRGTVVPFLQRRETEDDFKKELRLRVLDILALQEEVDGPPIPLRNILGCSIRNLCGETRLREILGEISTGKLVCCENGRVTITGLGREHFYAHSPREKVIRREILRALREAPGGMHITALRIRKPIRDACLHESQIDTVVCDLVEKGIVDWPNFIANIRLTGKGLAD